MRPDFGNLVQNFQFEGDFLRASPYGFGHINDTYTADFIKAGGERRRYILQRINHNVFKRPAELMHNIQRVTAHLREKIVAADGDPKRETLNLIPTVRDQPFFKTPDGNYWRAYTFIQNAQAYQVVKDLDHIANAAKAFGRFQELLSDLAADQLYETIPNFHHTGKRFEAFLKAVDRDTKNRAHLAQEEIAFVEQRVQETSILVDLIAQGQLPQRVIHNDTKFNNVLIDDETGEGVCIVDLDTVMPGLSLYDLGDLVRSGANPAAEDERDLSRVYLALDAFERLIHGYLTTARDFLTPLEMDYLPFAGKLITFECGMRFLTDYLDGDVYFKTHRENHNLDRCRAQFKLVQDIEKKFDQMVSIVEKHRHKSAEREWSKERFTA